MPFPIPRFSHLGWQSASATSPPGTAAPVNCGEYRSKEASRKLKPLKSRPTTIVFDLSGVLADINHTWQDAAAYAGVTGANLGDRPLRLLDFDGLRLFDGGQISVDDYMQGLAEFAGCTVDEAVLLHAGIHIAEFPGILALVT